MNTANKLTMLRVFLIPVFVVLLGVSFELNKFINNISLALFVFVIAGFTDFADGMIARRRGQETDFGAFMDPLADKILTFAAMIWFVEVGLMPSWLVLIVIIREFMVTGIRLVASAKGIVVAASMLGKLKTALTMACIISIFLIYIVSLREPFGERFAFSMVAPAIQWPLIACWALIGLSTVVSGVEYYFKNREIMKMGK